MMTVLELLCTHNVLVVASKELAFANPKLKILIAIYKITFKKTKRGCM